jgi:cytoskeletal protein CcmA (bactofilin family)
MAGIGNGVSGESITGFGVIGTGEYAGVVGQGGATGPGILALGSYGVVGGVGGEPSVISVNGVFPAVVTSLVNANKGFAALLSGKVLITDLLNGAAATFSGALSAASATFSGAVKAASATLSGALTAASGTFSGAVKAASATLSGALTGTSATMTGDVTVNGNINGKAAMFDGDVTVNGDISVTGDVILTNSGADCAEEFELKAREISEPGTVMVIDGGGTLRRSDRSYDRAVAGVVSGAGAYRPAIVLDKHLSSETRTTISLVGKAYCKVDASVCSIAVGDLLTTSDTPGHAMKVTDRSRGFGAVIGKALAPLESGLGLLPILIALQ